VKALLKAGPEDVTQKGCEFANRDKSETGMKGNEQAPQRSMSGRDGHIGQAGKNLRAEVGVKDRGTSGTVFTKKPRPGGRWEDSSEPRAGSKRVLRRQGGGGVKFLPSSCICHRRVPR